MQHYVIRDKEKKQFDQKIKPKLREGKTYVYCSFTYITPNYSILLFLQELYKFTQANNCKVILVMWDMSTLANDYYRKLKKTASDKSFIDQKIKELYDISYSLGFEEGSIAVYKSSDLWKRFISYDEEDIYQGFYSTLVQMRVEEYALSYRASYFIQIPLNLFFCNYFHKLFPEDVDQKIELIFFEEKREKLYKQARSVMRESGIITYESPTFVIVEDFPYLDYNDYEPEWNMSFPEIHEIINKSKTSRSEVLKVYQLLEVQPPSSPSNEELLSDLARKIYNYLKERKKAYDDTTGKVDEGIRSITDKEELHRIGGVLRSKLAVDLLIEADGKQSMSKIAKKMKKSIATLSTYAKRLKSMGLIRVTSSGNLKRTIKGVKINLELGI